MFLKSFLKSVGWASWLACVAAVVLSSCSSPRPREEEAELASPKAPNDTNGLQVYRRYCGSCHDPGHDDAPTLDDIETWDERAFRARTVLDQHLSQGYLKTPDDEDEPVLSEQTMDDVLHFMLTRIHALDE